METYDKRLWSGSSDNSSNKVIQGNLFSTVAWYLMQFGFYDAGMSYGYGGKDDRNNSAGAIIIVIVVTMLTWVISFLLLLIEMNFLLLKA